MSDEKILRNMRYVVEAVRKEAEVEAEKTGRKVVSVISTMIKPLIAAALSDDPDMLAITALDGRTREWAVTLEFWDTTEGTDRAELLSQSDMEVVRGFDGVAELIREYANLTHENQVKNAAAEASQLSLINIKRKLRGIRPAISRTGGRAMLRLYYAFGTEDAFVCRAKVQRYKKPIDIAGLTSQ